MSKTSMPPNRGRQARLAALRARLQTLAPGPQAGGARFLPLGVAALDRHLPGGGLPLGGLHEIEGARAEWDDGVATGFCLALLVRLTAALPGSRNTEPGHAGPRDAESRGTGSVLWAARRRDLYAPGLAAFGFDPGRLILARAGGEADVLWAMEEALRCSWLAAVVGEVDSLGGNAGRRLQLAAESGGVTAFLLRRRPRPAGRPPVGAPTRWRIAPARSATAVCPAGGTSSRPPRPGSDRFPGRPCWAVELLYCRGAAPGRWLLEWDDATGGFALAAALRDRPLAPASRPARTGTRGAEPPGRRRAG